MHFVGFLGERKRSMERHSVERKESSISKALNPDGGGTHWPDETTDVSPAKLRFKHSWERGVLQLLIIAASRAFVTCETMCNTDEQATNGNDYLHILNNHEVLKSTPQFPQANGRGGQNISESPGALSGDNVFFSVFWASQEIHSSAHSNLYFFSSLSHLLKKSCYRA
jgi:hypothetical protein